MHKKKHQQQQQQQQQHRQQHVHHDDSEEDIDYGKLARTELMRLQRTYRLMEGDQRDSAQESGRPKMSRQLRILDILKSEKDELETDLANAACKQNKMADARNQNFMTELLRRYEKYQAEINYCVEAIQEIEQQVDSITQRVISQNLKIMSLFGQSMTPPMAEKRLRVLENRLYHKTTKYDTLVSQNDKLRADINNILAERAAYHKRTVFVRKCNSKIKEGMMELVDVITSIYDTRDEYAMKIKSIREKDEKEARLHIHELAELQRMTHDSKKFHDFMKKKFRSRGEFEEEEQRKMRHLTTKENELISTVIAYKRTFKVILALGFTNDIDRLSVHYFEEEQTNFARFQYLNDLHNEAEVLGECVKLVKEEIEKDVLFQREEEEKRIITLEDMEHELEENRDLLEGLDEQLSNMEEEMSKCLTEFRLAFYDVGCEETFKKFLGNESGISVNNFSINFKILENKMEELLLLKAAFGLRKSVELEGGSLLMKSVALNQTKKPPGSGGPFKPKVIISGRIDATDEEGDDEKWLSTRPLSHSEIKYIIMAKFEASETTLAAADSMRSHSLDSPSQGSIYRRSSMIPNPIKQLDISKIDSRMDSNPSNKGHHRHSRNKSSGSAQQLSQLKVAGGNKESVDSNSKSQEPSASEPRDSVTSDVDDATTETTDSSEPQTQPQPQTEEKTNSKDDVGGFNL